MVVAAAAGLAGQAGMGLPEHEVGYGLRGGLRAAKAVTYEGQAPLSESLADGYDVVTEN